MSKSIYKPKPISGYPEWLPEIRAVEQQWFDHIRRVFESYGFCSIETPSVEELDVLTAKGEVDKEIYVIERLHKEDSDKEARLGLHFDQTVPFARYVAQHFNDLAFPFKRYQMQRVWRGERPQAGRFREFYQCDIDVINVDNLPISFDAEMPAIMWEIMSALPGMSEPFQIQISNRKIIIGYLQALSVSESGILNIMRAIDKIGKIKEEEICDLISKTTDAENIRDFNAEAFYLATNRKHPTSLSLRDDLCLLSGYDEAIKNETFRTGVDELCFVIDNLQHLPKGAVVADLSIVRGLDYYTGTVYETRFLDDPNYGSICSGGRYDDLAGSYISKHLPGVGISIGFSRLFDRMRVKNTLPKTRKSPTDILVALFDEAQRADALKTAAQLRQRGFSVEVFHAAQKLQKQFAYAEKKEIPYVWFLPVEGKGHEVKDMNQRTQNSADPTTWRPS